jgi:hypothetical protein
MRIYFEDLRRDIQDELVAEMMARLAEEGPDDSDDCLAERAAHVINVRNLGVDMDF